MTEFGLASRADLQNLGDDQRAAYQARLDQLKDIAKLWGGNLLRVWREVERVAAENAQG